MPASVQEHLPTAPAVTLSAKRSPVEGLEGLEGFDRSKEDAKVCWIEVKRYPYKPDHQVELLHLQAEADALLIMLQAAEQKGSREVARSKLQV